MMKKILMLLFGVITLVTAVSGCRTAHGAGEDIQNAGEAIQQNTPP